MEESRSALVEIALVEIKASPIKLSRIDRFRFMPL
jgi:hypothetical protein